MPESTEEPRPKGQRDNEHTSEHTSEKAAGEGVQGGGLSEIRVSEDGKSRLNMLDLAVQARDLRKSLLGMRLSNIYDFDSKTLVFKLGGSAEWFDPSADGQLDSHQEPAGPVSGPANSTNRQEDCLKEQGGGLSPRGALVLLRALSRCRYCNGSSDLPHCRGAMWL